MYVIYCCYKRTCTCKIQVRIFTTLSNPLKLTPLLLLGSQHCSQGHRLPQSVTGSWTKTPTLHVLLQTGLKTKREKRSSHRISQLNQNSNAKCSSKQVQNKTGKKRSSHSQLNHNSNASRVTRNGYKNGTEKKRNGTEIKKERPVPSSTRSTSVQRPFNRRSKSVHIPFSLNGHP